MFDVSICKVNLQIFKKGVFMKILLILFVLLNINILKSSEFDVFQKYYNISNNIMKSLVIADEEYIFYGDNGGVLRTYDGGMSWEQEFIGTHNFINDMKYNDGILYGCTSGGEVITSSNKGKKWKIIKVNNDNLNQIIYLDSKIFVISNSNELFVSYDFGENWSKIYIFEGLASKLESIEDKLIVSTQNNNLNSLLVSDNNGIDWQEIDLPKTNDNSKFNLKRTQNELVVFNNSTFSELNSDLSWDFYDVKEQVIFDLVKQNDNYYFINYNGDSLEIYIKEYSKVENKIIDSNIHSKIGMVPGDYRILCSSADSKSILLTSYNKTIVKLTDNKFEILSNFSKESTQIPVFYDSLNWICPSHMNYNGKGGNIIKTTNGGKTFFHSDFYFIDTSTINYTFYGNPIIYPLTKDTSIALVNARQNEIINFRPINIFLTYNNFTNLIKLDTNLGDAEKFKVIRKIKNDIYLCRQNDKDQKLEIFKLDKDLSISKISEIDHFVDVNFLNFYFEDDIIWLYGYNKRSSKRHFIYKCTDACINWELVFNDTFNGYSSVYNFVKSKNGKYYLFVGTSDTKIVEFEKLDGSNKFRYIYDPFEFKDERIYRSFGSTEFHHNKNFKYFEDLIYEHIFATQQNSEIKGHYFEVKLKIENDIIIVDTLKQFQKRIVNIKALFGESSIYYYDMNNIYIPIEDKSLISSVEILKPPSIWTYPPYPNPVKDRLKMKFYINNSADLSKLKLELINISSGKIYHLTDYKLSFLDDSMGEVEVNTKGYISGAYLINFKLGDANKSESIIIE